MSFLVTYNQRESFQPMSFAYSNLGPKWTFDWLSYVEDDLADPNQTVYIYSRGGGQETHIYNSVEQAFEPHLETRAALTRVSELPIEYRKELPDGSIEVFSVSDGGTSSRRAFLSRWIDPQGNALQFHYNGTKLVAVEDAIGQVSTLYYEHPTDPFLITKVEDPFGRFATFGYNEEGRLQKITDVIGLSSEFEYGEQDFVTALITPYGRTSFTMGERKGLRGFGVDRWIEVEDPLGARERIEFLMELSGMEPRAPAEKTPNLPGIHNGNLQFRNTFCWNKLAMDRHPGDHSMAKLTHWLKTGGSGDLNLTSGVKQNDKMPLENRVWYNYPGKILFNRGNRIEPTEIARVLDGLLDRYAPSTICSHLRVNAARFKQVRESGGAVVGEKRFKGHGRTGATGRSPRTVQDRSAAERVTALAPSGNAFVELPQFGMGLGGGMMTPPLGEVQHGASRCRLTVESAAGSLTVVTASGEGENELVEAVCRFVLGALEGSSRA